jgi:hypothetical protein
MANLLFSEDICQLCCSDFNKMKHSKVSCPGCEFPVCRECTRTYLLSVKEPHCLNCKTRWQLDTLINNTLKSFVNKDYKQHKMNMLFEHEQSRMPETMHAVENYKKVNQLKEEQKIQQEKLYEAERAYHLLKEKNNQLKETIRKYEKGETKLDKREFKKACPKEGCRGFLSTQWKCGLCDTKVCSKCFAIKNPDEEHECNEDDVKSAEAIKKETRNCPTCGTSIYKIMGCDQMWCVQCHTAFSWKTGLKLNGVIHNPHFFQWQAEGATEAPVNLPGVEMCGGLPNWFHYKNNLRTFINNKFTPGNSKEIKYYYDKFVNIYRSCSHFANWELDKLRRKCNEVNNNLTLRVKYMAGEICEDVFKRTIITRDRKYNKSRAILEVYELINIILTETLRDVTETIRNHLFNHINEISTEKDAINYFDGKLDRINKVRMYSNLQLVKISVMYSQTVGILDRHFYSDSNKFYKKDIQHWETQYKEMYPN